MSLNIYSNLLSFSAVSHCTVCHRAKAILNRLFITLGKHSFTSQNKGYGSATYKYIYKYIRYYQNSEAADVMRDPHMSQLQVSELMLNSLV